MPTTDHCKILGKNILSSKDRQEPLDSTAAHLVPIFSDSDILFRFGQNCPSVNTKRQSPVVETEPRSVHAISVWNPGIKSIGYLSL